MQSKLKLIIPVLILAGSMVAPTRAQDFTFTTPDGGSVALSGMRGRVVVLLFASTADPQCRDEFKALESIAERYKGKSVGLYWVSLDPASVTNDKLKSPCGPTGSISILRDQSRAAFKRFSGRAPQLPTIVVLDQQGQLQGQPRGGFNPDSDFVNDIAAVIDGLLARK
jgi:peroxiredoxin